MSNLKDLKISKELIKAVLESEVSSFGDDFDFMLHDNCILFSHDGEMQFDFNIYEFVFKCKKWLIKNELSYSVRYDDYFKNYKCDIMCYGDDESLETFATDTEVGAVVQACMWLLNQENKNEN